MGTRGLDELKKNGDSFVAVLDKPRDTGLSLEYLLQRRQWHAGGADITYAAAGGRGRGVHGCVEWGCAHVMHVAVVV